MTMKMTERDKKLLAGLGVFCVAAILTLLVILPMHKANAAMKEQIAANEEQIALVRQKEAELPLMRAGNEDRREMLLDAQRELYPLLKTQDVDRLMTEKAMLHGLSVRKLQIAMPQEAANVSGYGKKTDAGSNPDKKDGVWIASVSLDVDGPTAAMDRLIDDIALHTPGVRITGLNWSSARRQVNAQSGLTEQYDLLSLRLEVAMSRKEYDTDE